jgi:NADH-quinone oxidoreductase subunit H
LRFALFFMAEYINMIIVSSVATIVFLGGWWGPFGILPGPWWFVVKVIALLYIYVWLRATLPRMRYDRLMALSWKSLFPLSLAMMMVTAIVVVAAQGTL